jgi:hypothetical protein
MVYQQKLVAVIKHNGKILREKDNNTVYLPFLAEYEIFMKNLESRDVVINISIDGEDVLDNQQLVIKAGSNCSLEGFMKGNKVSNRFKFIQKTGKIQNNRGDRIDDGLIRIEYKYTKLTQTITTTTYHHVHHTHIDQHWYHPHLCDCPACRSYRIRPLPYVQPYFLQPHIYTNSTGGGAIGGSVYNASAMNVSASFGGSGGGGVGGSGGVVHSNAFLPQFDEGITVKGSESNQQLSEVEVAPLEDQSYVIILKLSGYSGKTDQPVEKPVLVKAKIKCSTCGRQSKSHIKYCPECGTFLN